MQSVSAGSVRGRGKTSYVKPEKPKPQPLFKEGDMVSVHTWKNHRMQLSNSNAIIVGKEWGANHRDINRDIWCYYVKDVYIDGQGWALIPQDQLGQIS